VIGRSFGVQPAWTALAGHGAFQAEPHGVWRAVLQSMAMKKTQAPARHVDVATAPVWFALDMDADAFASLVRHELNNPLNAMSGWLHLLAARSDLSPDITQRALEGARRAVDQQIEQIGLLSRVLQLSGSPSTLRTTLNPLESLAAEWEAALRAAGQRVNRGLRWRHAADLDLSVTLSSDKAALGTAIVQLAQPALKHAAEGAELQVDLTRCGDELCLCLGIEEDGQNASSVWYLLDAERGNLTLELLHARLVVQAHGGRLDRAETAQGGSTLQIRLSLDGNVPLSTSALRRDEPPR
jgi:signal transduction histidine kinase